MRQEELATSEELSRVRAQSAKTGESLAEAILKLEILDEEDLFFLLSRRLGISAVPEARLLHLTLSPDLRRRIPRSLARRGILVPFDIDKAGRRLSVAMLDPSDGETVSHLRHVSGVTDVHVYLARRSVILASIDVAYGVGPDVRDRVVVDDLALTDPEPQGETQVELIPGKVSLDPELLREMAAISPRLVEESLHPKLSARGSQESPHVIRPGGRGPRPPGQRGPAVRPRVTPARGSIPGRPSRAASRPQNMSALPQNMA
ncbi:MAG: hypothetical protein KAI47_02975, partial [Deltaproteobacteria bacterium]|nr:hypothetical protein [Deltaproteobacteria bacterium]